MTDQYFEPEQEKWVNEVLVAVEQDREQALALLRTHWRTLQTVTENRQAEFKQYRENRSKLQQRIEELEKQKAELLSGVFKKQWLGRLLLLAGEIANEECLTDSGAQEKYAEY